MWPPFTPVGDTVAITCNNTPTAVSGTLAPLGEAHSVRVFNSGTVPVFIRLRGTGASSVDIPMGIGSTDLFMYEGTSISAISSTTTSAVVYFTPGRGE